MKTFVADFETTVYAGQERTDVWSAAVVELFTEDVIVFNCIDNFIGYLDNIGENATVYFHNLKFDGSFILNYYFGVRKYEQAFHINEEDMEDCYKMKKMDMPHNSISYLISNTGQWYSILVRNTKYFIEFRDSLKLLPFSVKKIGRDFKTKHQKLSIEYLGYREPNGIITDEEREYIKNDVLVVKEALELLFKQGHKKSTIGSCCLTEYKRVSFLDEKDYFRRIFPDLRDVLLDKDIYGSETAEEYIRHSYKGGWCYAVPGKTSRILSNGFTLDVNSLYPSMMHSMSGNLYPYGLPTFWHGNYIPEEVNYGERYYFIRIKTRFYIKRGKLPCIQIKDKACFYPATKWLETSDVPIRDNKGRLTGAYSPTYIDSDGTEQLATVILTLTMTDYKLIKDHYDLKNFEILDGVWFEAKRGLFDDYLDKYRRIKMESTGALRELAKLFQNNLYGKFATSPDSSYKLAKLDTDGHLIFADVTESNKEVIYIPVGSAITSYARNFTIRAAQQNFHGKNKHGFVYADTDSIHCEGMDVSEVKGVTIDSKEYCCWKHESSWEKGIFIRQKTYAELIKGEWDIKCAGMSDECKELFLLSINPLTSKILQDEDVYDMLREDYSEEKLEFLMTPRTIRDFKIGLKIPGKLIPKQIPGGVVLSEVSYEIKETFRGIRGF